MSAEGNATEPQGQINWAPQPYFDGKDTSILKAPVSPEAIFEETPPIDIGKYPVKLLVRAA